MQNFFRTVLAVVLTTLVAALSAQTSGDDFVKALATKLKAAAAYDHAFPREKAFVHLDNNAYVEGDTIWWSAIVVRASTLRPTDVSRVLYVELLDAAGQTVERQLAKIDDSGFSTGCFSLKEYNRQGFYEVRAYTRAMLNWGEAACFSRVIPVFERDGNTVDITAPDKNWVAPATAKRKYNFEGKKVRRLSFFPEGGHRVEGLEQRMAFLLTDGDGHWANDTVWICKANGERVAQGVVLHEGRGLLTLPPMLETGSYAEVLGQHFELPEAQSEGYTMRIDQADGYVDLRVERSQGMPYEPIGLAVVCREQPCYFDTLSVAGVEEFSLPATVLRGGVNRIELFDAKGRSLASRMVMAPLRNHQLAQVEVVKNAKTYEAHVPIALGLKVKNAQGEACKALMSVSVTDGSQQLVAPSKADVDVAMLLSSEVRGYVHNPRQYFEGSGVEAARRLDLLLMVQGWRAVDFNAMCNHEEFKPTQPIEDKLVLNGVAFKDNERREALSGVALSLVMYNKSGDVRRATCTTDEEGRFAFASSADYEGEWLTQVTTRTAEGKKVWSRVAFDRWFSPKVRNLQTPEFSITPPIAFDSLVAQTSVAVVPDVVDWSALDTEDTYVLGEAQVTANRLKRYKPLNGNRFEWNGGVKHGRRYAEQAVDIERELEKWRDAGYDGRVSVIELLNVVNGKGRKGAVAQFDDAAFEMEVSDENPFAEETEETEGTQEEEVQNSENLLQDSQLGDNSQTIKVDGENWHVEYASGRGNAEFAEDFKIAYLVRSYGDMARLIGAHTLEAAAQAHDPIDAVLILHENKEARRSKKGLTYRKVWGFEPHVKFFAPNYNLQDLPEKGDQRRTLLWVPKLSTNDAGEANLMLFNNSSHGSVPIVSVQGMTQDGRFFSY